MLAGAEKARDAVGFHVVSDPKTGAKIGAPTKLLDARAGARLDIASSADADLKHPLRAPQRRNAEPQGRLQGDEARRFLLSFPGQEGPSEPYTVQKNALASPPIRGFAFAYPASLGAQLDRIAIAVANWFERSLQQRRGRPAPAAAAAAADRAPAPPHGQPQPTATALIVAQGHALTALKRVGLPNPMVDGEPIQVRARRAPRRASR